MNVQIRRLGGSYGGKISRANIVAAACAIAAAELSSPVRISLDFNTNMALVGGRLPYYCKYKVGLIIFKKKYIARRPSFSRFLVFLLKNRQELTRTVFFKLSI